MVSDIPADDNLAGEMPSDIPEDAGVAGEPMPSDDGMEATPITPGEKHKFTGDWKCAGCGGAITSLPFTPRDTSNLKCLECFKQSKN
jgi:CxxC-x17-CxxC domain-containing protein